MKQKKLVKDGKQRAKKVTPSHVYFVIDLTSTFTGFITQSRKRAIKAIQRNGREESPSTEDKADQNYLGYLDELMNHPESLIEVLRFPIFINSLKIFFVLVFF